MNAAPAGAQVLISGVYFDGYLPGNPEPEEGVRIINKSRRKIDISGWYISDEYGPQPFEKRPDGARGEGSEGAGLG